MPQLAQFHLENAVTEEFTTPAEQILDGDPQGSIAVLWRNAEGTAVAGIFRSSVGTLRTTQAGDEWTHVRKGRLRVTAQDGSVVDCCAGDVMFIPRDAECIFEVLEELEDYFVITNPDGVQL